MVIELRGKEGEGLSQIEQIKKKLNEVSEKTEREREGRREGGRREGGERSRRILQEEKQKHFRGRE